MDRDELLSRARDGLLAAARALYLALAALVVGIALFVVGTLSTVLIVIGVGMLLAPPVLAAVRGFADHERRLAREWAGVEIPVPYRPRPAGALHRVWSLVTDPATWRDLLWLLLNVPVSVVLGLIPAALVVYGLEGIFVIPFLQPIIPEFNYGIGWAVDVPGEPLLAVPQGVLLLAAGLVLAPHAVRLRAMFSRSLLAPTRQAALALRVRQLTDTRAETVDAQAAELRRIERDLHDGAQARLVALGMSLGMAEQLFAKDPEAALELLTEARQASGEALADLRDLVRGIHPPVLAERGLDGAVRALVLTLPLPVGVEIDLAGRPPAPVESAAYFAVAETLTNVAKHSRAGTAWVRLAHAGGVLSIVVGDDGVGGVDPRYGTGLRGIERRLAAFDGKLAVSSPTGGPTVVTMELPCA
jgi:signal transduction histidine kinase